MDLSQFITETLSNKRTKEHDTWTPKIGLPLTESLVVNTYAEVESILSNNPLMNFFISSDSFGVFLNKTLGGSKIGKLIAKDKSLFKTVCDSWIYPSELMEFADDSQLIDCAKYMVEEAHQNVSYDDPATNTAIKYCINQIKDYEFSKNVAISLVKLCSLIVVDETVSETEKFIKSFKKK